MSAVFPNIHDAQRHGFCPAPAEDNGAAVRRRVFSALKYMGIIDEILALAEAEYVPILNVAGVDLAAGPLCIPGGVDVDLDFFVNGAAAQGATSIGVDGAFAEFAAGMVFTIAGVYCNDEPDLQRFVASDTLLAPGTMNFTPALPSAAADNAQISILYFYNAAVAYGREATHLVLAAVPNQTHALAYKLGLFTSTLDCSGAAKGDPVYLSAIGGLSLAAPDPHDAPVQVVGYVYTAANPGVIRGMINPPLCQRIGLPGTAARGSGVLDAGGSYTPTVPAAVFPATAYTLVFSAGSAFTGPLHESGGAIVSAVGGADVGVAISWTAVYY